MTCGNYIIFIIIYYITNKKFCKMGKKLNKIKTYIYVPNFFHALYTMYAGINIYINTV